MEQLTANVQTAIRTAETLCRILQAEDLPVGIRVNTVNAQLYELNVVLDTIGLSPVDIERMGTLALKLPVNNLYHKLRATLDVLYKLDASLNRTGVPVQIVPPTVELVYLVYLDNGQPWDDHDRHLCNIYTNKDDAVSRALELEQANPRHTYGWSYATPYCVIQTWNMTLNQSIINELSDGRKE